MKNKTTFVAVIGAAALAGLMTGTSRAASVVTGSGAGVRSASSARVTPTASIAGNRARNLDDQAGKHDCKGKNDCKGAGGCKSGDNGCKGKNSCKGKGGCKSASADTQAKA